MSNYIEIKAIEIRQPIGSFYIGVINHKDLIKISYADKMRKNPVYNNSLGNNTIDEYLGIQRDLSSPRIKELSNYVNLMDATFPTSVLLAISSDKLFYRDNSLYIKDEENVAIILDGQHRIAGLKSFNGPDDGFQINTAIFVDMDIEDQAMVFATINLKQQQMNKSLSYNLYEYSKTRSPQKTCHNIALFLSKTMKSPFYNKIKMLGKASEQKTETLSQATFVEGIIKYISLEPMLLRDQLRRKQSTKFANNGEIIKTPFKNFFLRDEDEKITLIIWNYFEAISEKWPKAWHSANSGYILAKSTGYSALIKLLREIINHYKLHETIPSKSFFAQKLEKCDIQDDDFNIETFKPGETGINDLYKRLYESILK